MIDGVVYLRPCLRRDPRVARRLTDKQAIAFAGARKIGVRRHENHKWGSICFTLLTNAWEHPVEKEFLPEVPF